MRALLTCCLHGVVGAAAVLRHRAEARPPSHSGGAGAVREGGGGGGEGARHALRRRPRGHGAPGDGDPARGEESGGGGRGGGNAAGGDPVDEEVDGLVPAAEAGGGEVPLPPRCRRRRHLATVILMLD